MHIVLATAPRGGGAIERSRIPPMGIAFLGGAVERAGMKVTIVDVHTDNLDVDGGAAKILAAKPDIVGVSCLSHNRFQAIDMIKRVKRDGKVPVIVGGYHFTHTAADAIRVVPEIDYVCRGEGEHTLVELLEALSAGTDPAKVAGLFLRDANGEPKYTGIRHEPDDLDELPDPAWHLYDLSKYTRPIDGTDIRSIGVMSSRGCPSACVFCADALTKLRLRSPKRFVAEVEMLHRQHGFPGFDFWDDTMTMNWPHVHAICDEIIARGLDITWYCRARVNMVNQELLRKMRAAGCKYISYGIESGSPRILQLIKKKITLDHVRRAVGWSLEADMHVRLNFIASHPDETEEDLLMTLRFMKEMEAVDPRVQSDYAIMTIYPGTPLEPMAVDRGLFPRNFSWNTPVEFPKAVLAGIPPSLPYYEQNISLERIRALILKELNPPATAVAKALSRMRRIRSLDDARSFGLAGARYVASYFQ